MTDTPESPEAWARKVLERHDLLPIRDGEALSRCCECDETWPCEAAQGARHVLALTEALTFREFQDANRRRCEGGFGHRVAWDEPYWPLQNWALAIAGEAGELCNIVKKCLRGDFTVDDKRDEILAELADVMTYCDLAMSSLGADTGETIMAKFNVVSERIGYRAALAGEAQ